MCVRLYGWKHQDLVAIEDETNMVATKGVSQTGSAQKGEGEEKQHEGKVIETENMLRIITWPCWGRNMP